MKDLKYLAAYSIPVVAFLGLYFQGIYSYLTPVYGFIIIPALELIFPVETDNLSENEVDSKSSKVLFDWLLYLNLPMIFGLIIWSFFIVSTQNLETYEFIGLVVTLGIVLGVNGINVAHELGHRQQTNERFIGKRQGIIKAWIPFGLPLQ